MPETPKLVAIAFMAIITGLFAGIVMPELFDNLINQSSNRQMYQSIRIFVIIFILFVVSSSFALFTERGN